MCPCYSSQTKQLAINIKTELKEQGSNRLWEHRIAYCLMFKIFKSGKKLRKRLINPASCPAV